MPSNPTVSVVAANAQADAVGALLANGLLKFIDSQGMTLSTLRFDATAPFRQAADGMIMSNPLTPDMSAVGGGNADRFICQTSDGQDVFGGTCGVAIGGQPSTYDYTFATSTFIPPGGEVHASAIFYRAWYG